MNEWQRPRRADARERPCDTRVLSTQTSMLQYVYTCPLSLSGVRNSKTWLILSALGLALGWSVERRGRPRTATAVTPCLPPCGMEGRAAGDRQPQSRAAAAAHRRISASAARRKTASEVLLLTSKSFPSGQYQALLNFVKGLGLPADTTSLFTTVRNERVAERKALLSAHSQEDVVSAPQLYPSLRVLASHQPSASRLTPALTRGRRECTTTPR